MRQGKASKCFMGVERATSRVSLEKSGKGLVIISVFIIYILQEGKRSDMVYKECTHGCDKFRLCHASTEMRFILCTWFGEISS